jgi:hypothetical protein
LGGVTSLLALVGFGIAIAMIVQAFKVRRILRDHFNGYLKQNIYWSGVMVFFFNFYYLQYKINRLREHQFNAYGPPPYRAPYG